MCKDWEGSTMLFDDGGWKNGDGPTLTRSSPDDIFYESNQAHR